MIPAILFLKYMKSLRCAMRHAKLVLNNIFLVCFLTYNLDQCQSVHTLLVLLVVLLSCVGPGVRTKLARSSFAWKKSKNRIIKELPHVDCGDGGATAAPAATEAIPREWIPSKSKDSNDSSSAYDGDKESLLDWWIKVRLHWLREMLQEWRGSVAGFRWIC